MRALVLRAHAAHDVPKRLDLARLIALGNMRDQSASLSIAETGKIMRDMPTSTQRADGAAGVPADSAIR